MVEYGRRLSIDLTGGKVTKEKISEDIIDQYIGGKGFIAKILYDELKPKTDPLSPDNILIVATGPLTGTDAPAFSKTAFAAKSPLTEIFADSYVGGHFGPVLRSAGFDLITFSGKAAKPVLLMINDNEVKIEDASGLWGKDVLETEKALIKKYGDNVEIASIGPAGEKLVSYACICHRIYRQAGRGGLGAVMGSKNLKAIVVKGSSKLQVADKAKFDEVTREANAMIRGNKILQEGLSVSGTLTMLPMAQAQGIATVDNYSKGVMDDKTFELLSWATIENTYKLKHHSCFRCPIACAKRFAITGKWGNFDAETEFETLMLLGPNIGINDFSTIAYLGSLCDRAGMDTIQAGNALSFAMECYEKGLISKSDTDGLELKFGNEKDTVKMINHIASNTGFGKLLAQGSKKAAEKIGKESEKFAMQVKGMAFPAAWDVRGSQGHGLSFAVSDRGACHLSADIDLIEQSGAPGVPDRFTLEGKPQIEKDTEDIATLRETLISCIFNFLSPDIYLQFLNTASGMNKSMDDFLQAGDRIEQLIRAFNIREAGISRKDDTLPYRIFEEGIPEGPSKDHKIDRKLFNGALDTYYELRSWNKDGIPTKGKLEELGLQKAAKEIGV
jgi:aldehyde:ferredoxin oxidoreductase